MNALPLLLLTLVQADPATRPGVGDAAPAFSAPATSGATVTLAEFAKKKTVVLAFFPKAFTGG